MQKTTFILHTTSTSRSILYQILADLNIAILGNYTDPYITIDTVLKHGITHKEVKGKKFIHLTRANLLQLKLLNIESVPYYLNQLINE